MQNKLLKEFYFRMFFSENYRKLIFFCFNIVPRIEVSTELCNRVHVFFLSFLFFCSFSHKIKFLKQSSQWDERYIILEHFSRDSN